MQDMKRLLAALLQWRCLRPLTSAKKTPQMCLFWSEMRQRDGARAELLAPPTTGSKGGGADQGLDLEDGEHTHPYMYICLGTFIDIRHSPAPNPNPNHTN